MAAVSNAGWSRKNPMPLLHRTHNRPRTFPLWWQWSTCIRRGRSNLQSRCVFSFLQIAHTPSCEASRASYSSREIPYFLLRWMSAYFDGFCIRCFLKLSRIAGLSAQSLQKGWVLFQFADFCQKAVKGLIWLQRTQDFSPAVSMTAAFCLAAALPFSPRDSRPREDQ